MVYIVPFNFCNIASVKNYLIKKNIIFSLLSNNSILEKNDDLLILPGVGSFKEGMNFLAINSMDEKIRRFASQGGQIFGICLGMQLLFEFSEESKNIIGLSIIKGGCHILKSTPEFPVPRIGWDSIYFDQKKSSYYPKSKDSKQKKLKASSSDYYFAHSYFCCPKNSSSINAWFKHREEFFCASVKECNITGVQFHPEKSGDAGYKLLDSIILKHEKKNNSDNSN